MVKANIGKNLCSHLTNLTIHSIILIMNYMNKMISKYPSLKTCEEEIIAAFDILKETYNADGTVLTCGNGGSASDAEHIVGELMKSFCKKRPMPPSFTETVNDEYLSKNLETSLRAVSLCGHLSLSTAFANDAAPDLVFAQLLYGLGRKNDTLWAISTSGNSKNVIYALKTARAKGIQTIGLTGKSGGQMKELCDVCIKVPAEETYLVQEFHLPVYHTLCLMIEDHFFAETS